MAAGRAALSVDGGDECGALLVSDAHVLLAGHSLSLDRYPLSLHPFLPLLYLGRLLNLEDTAHSVPLLEESLSLLQDIGRGLSLGGPPLLNRTSLALLLEELVLLDGEHVLLVEVVVDAVLFLLDHLLVDDVTLGPLLLVPDQSAVLALDESVAGGGQGLDGQGGRLLPLMLLFLLGALLLLLDYHALDELEDAAALVFE